MSTPLVQRILLISNPQRPPAEGMLERVQKLAAEAGATAALIETPQGRKLERMDLVADLAIVFGGDGTMLSAAHMTRGLGIPLLGVNTGHLGFLCPLTQPDFLKEFAGILQHKFVIERRNAIQVEFKGGSGWALNDLGIDRSTKRIFEAEVFQNGVPITRYKADGLICTTATGSTAYNLSLGGPVMAPDIRVLTFTPKAPLSMTNRSLVLDGTNVIRIRLGADSGPAALDTDGVTITELQPGDEFRLHCSAVSVPLAFLPEYNQWQTLGLRLGWNVNNIPEAPVIGV